MATLLSSYQDRFVQINRLRRSYFFHFIESSFLNSFRIKTSQQGESNNIKKIKYIVI